MNGPPVETWFAVGLLAPLWWAAGLLLLALLSDTIRSLRRPLAGFFGWLDAHLVPGTE